MTGKIHTHRWYPSSLTDEPAKGVYLLHGIGEHAGRYERLANRLTNMGYIVGAHDHPGHGESAGKRGVLMSASELELVGSAQLAEFAREIDAKPYLFGHSLGGLVAASMVLNHDVDVAGLMLSAPAFEPFVSRWNRTKLALLNTVAPRFHQQLAYEAHKLTHDETEQQMGTNDPLNHRYKSASIVVWLIRVGRLTLSKANRITVPTLILMAGDDVVVKTDAIKRFAESVPAQYLTQHCYTGFRHEVLNETPERRNRVMDDIEHWLNQLT